MGFFASTFDLRQLVTQNMCYYLQNVTQLLSGNIYGCNNTIMMNAIVIDLIQYHIVRIFSAD